jgi:hypothetical protein
MLAEFFCCFFPGGEISPLKNRLWRGQGCTKSPDFRSLFLASFRLLELAPTPDTGHHHGTTNVPIILN